MSTLRIKIWQIEILYYIFEINQACCIFFNSINKQNPPIQQKLEGTACYAGLLLAPPEGFDQGFFPRDVK